MRYHEIIIESKANIINLGYPEIIAKLFYKNFGKYAYLMAKWFKDYHMRSMEPDPKKWFKFSFSSFSLSKRDLSPYNYVELYNSTDSVENYLKMRKELKLWVDENDIHDEEYLRNQREYILNNIDKELFTGSHTIFNYYSLPKDILSGKIKDINRYKDLKFMDAQYLYDQYLVFDQTKPLKTYRDGYKWINVGKRCPFVGKLMKNCGSAGVMGNDEDRTMIVLFDENNNSHVITTYHPNENRLSGDQGIAGSEVKKDYHKYVLDLANLLNAELDDRSKSTLLSIKYLLRNKAKNITQLSQHDFNQIFRFEIDGKTYYSDSQKAITKDDLMKFMNLIRTNQINLSDFTHLKRKTTLTVTELIKILLNYRNEFNIKNIGITPILLRNLK